MTQENIDRFFKRNQTEALKQFIDDCNEFNDPYYLVLCVIDEDWEYGYDDYTFKYDSIEEFVEKGPEDVRKWGEPVDIVNLIIQVTYYSEEFNDGYERVTIDEM